MHEIKPGVMETAGFSDRSVSGVQMSWLPGTGNAPGQVHPHAHFARLPTAAFDHEGGAL
jgi:hypothetical protein